MREAPISTISILLLIFMTNSLAWAEMNLILAKVIWAFDMELGKGTKEDWSDQRVWLLHEKAPLYVKISPRAGSGA